MSGCWVSRVAVWRPGTGQSEDARELCGQEPTTTLQLGDGYEVVICGRHVYALKAALWPWMVDAGGVGGHDHVRVYAWNSGSGTSSIVRHAHGLDEPCSADCDFSGMGTR